MKATIIHITHKPDKTDTQATNLNPNTAQEQIIHAIMNHQSYTLPSGKIIDGPTIESFNVCEGQI